MNRTFRVKVIPGSARSGVTGELADGVLKVKIAAAPERGKANEELRRVLAEHYGVPKSSVRILSGHTAGLKLVRVAS
ncbi:MAG TPA: DUF167 domain-containing protein [Bryobacteraceae bacterium]|nr:DUF167 domain-containing protein [Bryobacteraceae bacterium]